MSAAPVGPPKEEYGADEISALVLDPGYSVVRAGFAGEDTPKSVVPTYYGATDKSNGEPSYLFDDSAIHNPLPDLDIRNPMAKDGTVVDWDLAVKLWEYSITSRLTGPRERPSIRHSDDDKAENDDDAKMDGTEGNDNPQSDYPLIMTEPAWNPAKNRERTLEVAIEEWGCPAFWLGRSGVLAAFASGKPTALVVDIGASTASITPVHDGLILKKGTMKSPLAGNWVSEQLRLLFSQSQPPVSVTPHYMVTSKTPVDAGAAAQATLRPFARPPKDTFKRLQEERVLTEFKESCVQIWNPANNQGQGLAASADAIRSIPGRTFEFPDGWNNVFGHDRFRAAEGMFDEKMALTSDDTPAATAAQTIPGMVRASLSAVDVDIRPHLLANVVVTGGSSLLNGFNDRLTYEIQNQFQGSRVRIQSPGSIVERKYAAWIGGSILASLGSFHQMWISKKEYEEVGPGIVEKRCK